MPLTFFLYAVPNTSVNVRAHEQLSSRLSTSWSEYRTNRKRRDNPISLSASPTPAVFLRRLAHRAMAPLLAALVMRCNKSLFSLSSCVVCETRNAKPFYRFQCVVFGRNCSRSFAVRWPAASSNCLYTERISAAAKVFPRHIYSPRND